MTSFREDSGNESFEAGRDLWHARIRRANRNPLTVHGVAFPHLVARSYLEVGSGWPDGTTTIGNLRTHVDCFRTTGFAQRPIRNSTRQHRLTAQRGTA